MTDREVAQVIAYLSEAFRAEMSETEIMIWRGHVQDLDAGLAEAAAHRCVKSLRFMPKIAEFHDAYRAERRARNDPALSPSAHVPADPANVKRLADEARARLGR